MRDNKMFTGFEDPRNDYGYSEEYYKYWVVLGSIFALVAITGLTFIIATALIPYFT